MLYEYLFDFRVISFQATTYQIFNIIQTHKWLCRPIPSSKLSIFLAIHFQVFLFFTDSFECWFPVQKSLKSIIFFLIQNQNWFHNFLAFFIIQTNQNFKLTLLFSFHNFNYLFGFSLLNKQFLLNTLYFSFSQSQSLYLLPILFILKSKFHYSKILIFNYARF